MAARHSEVVGWSPVPKAIFGSMTMRTLSWGAESASHGGPTQSRPTCTDLMRAFHSLLQSCCGFSSRRMRALGKSSAAWAWASLAVSMSSK
jgi:hypothetical protein